MVAWAGARELTDAGEPSQAEVFLGTRGGQNVQGTVSDEYGPLAGVTILVTSRIRKLSKSLERGAVSNEWGEFALEGMRIGDVMKFLYVGYKTKEVIYRGEWNLKVELEVDSKLLDEVIITALGIGKEARSLGYAVSSLAGGELMTAGSPTLGGALYGKASGLRVRESTGGAMSSLSLTVRGLSSLTGNTQPLLVVDGVPVRNGNANNADSWDADRIYSNGIVDINGEDVESLSVLKGASAAALYGSEAANGVILVTTKRGYAADRGVAVDFSATLQGNYVAYMPKVQTEYGPGLQGSFCFGPLYAAGREVLYWDGSVRNYEAITQSPLADLFRTGMTQTYHLAVSKAAEHSQGRFSYTYLDELPNQYNSSYGKHHFHGSGTLVAGKLKLGYQASYLRQRIKNRPRVIGSMIDQLHSFDDMARLRQMIQASLTHEEPFIYDNPTAAKDYFWSILAVEQAENNSRLMAGVTPEWTFTRGLKLRGRLSTDLTAEDIERRSQTGKPLALDTRNNKYEIYYGELLLMWEQQLGAALALTANLGYQGRSERLAAATPNAGQQQWQSMKTAWLGTAGLSLFRTLYLEGTLRREKSSTLYPHHTFLYPSGNMSFVFSELFPKGCLWNYGKLRLSYGVVGNAPAAVYASNMAYIHKTLNDIPYQTIDQDITNQALRPETKYEWEAGIESFFWGGRLGFELSCYRNRVEDQMLLQPTAISYGAKSILRNIGTIANQGFEVDFLIRPIDNRLVKWQMQLNYAFNRNKVLALADGSRLIEHELVNSNAGGGGVFIWSRVGEPMGDIMTYAPLQDARGNALIGPDGLYIVNYGKENLKKAGNAIPSATAGLTTSLSIGPVYLEAVADCRIGGYVVSDGYRYTIARGIHPASLAYRDVPHAGLAYYFPGDDLSLTPVPVSNVYHEGPERIYYNGVILPGVKADAQGNILYNEKGKPLKNDVIVPSDKYYSHTPFDNSVFDNTYIKLREVVLGYRLSEPVLERIGCKSMTISLFGRNVCYFLKNKSGYDPESTSGTAWQNQIFLGAATAATTRSWGLSFRASF